MNHRIKNDVVEDKGNRALQLAELIKEIEEFVKNNIENYIQYYRVVTKSG